MRNQPPEQPPPLGKEDGELRNTLVAGLELVEDDEAPADEVEGAEVERGGV